MTKLAISKDPQLSFLPLNADAWWTRFQVFPFDKRSLLTGQNTTTCYLDTQINMALLIFVLGFTALSKFWKKRKTGDIFIILGFTLFFITTLMSLSTLPYDFLPKQFKLVQFGWRLITYQNLSLFVTFLGLIIRDQKLFTDIKTSPFKMAIIAASLTLAFVNMTERITHSMGARNPSPNLTYKINAPQDLTFVTIPPWYLYSNYLVDDILSVPKESIQPNRELNFEVGLAKNFGETQPNSFNQKEAGWVLTNVAAFDWNKIYEDGYLLGSQKIRRNGNFLVVWIDSGTHTMTTAFDVPFVFKFLRSLSQVSLLLLFFSFGVVLPRWPKLGLAAPTKT